MNQTPLERVLALLSDIQPRGEHEYQACCPAHDDKKRSLSINENAEGNVGIFCHAGCTFDAIVAALGIKKADLFAVKKTSTGANNYATAKPRIITAYPYTDAQGILLYEVCRFEPKDFRQRRPDGAGGFVWNLRGVQRVLYRLPYIHEAVTAGGQTIYVVEGEKDADRLVALGLMATTNAGGAEKWEPSFTEALRGASVVLLPDNDQPGRKHAERVAGSLMGVARAVKIVTLPDLPEKGDVSDYLDAGHTASDLEQLAARAPFWVATRVQSDAAARADERAKKEREKELRRAAQDKAIREASKLPVIETNNRHLRDITRDAFAALEKANDPPTIYARGGKLVDIVQDEKGAPGIRILDMPSLRYRLARVANFVSTSDDRGCVAVPPSATLIDDMFAHPDLSAFQSLESIVSSPVVSPDGTLVTQPGYVASARVFYHERDAELSKRFGKMGIGPKPTQGQVDAAVSLLLETLLGDFPFVDDASRCHALCALLQPFVRACIQGNTPLYLVDAPTQGTGKSLLAQTLIALFLGRVPASTSCPDRRNDEEWRKLLTTTLMDGPSHLWFDNLKYRLESASLAQALTSQAWHDRLLGANDNVTLPIRCTWFLTANNIELDADYPRRSIWIRLDARVERPEERDMNRFAVTDLERYVLDERPALIGAVVTLLRAWLAAGRPIWNGTPLGSYASWCRVMGGMMQTLGVPGFLENRKEFYQKSDPEREQWKRFITAWWDKYQETPVGTSELIEIAVECEIVPDQERGSKNVFGRRLRERVSAIVAGHVILSSGTAQRAAQYRLAPVGLVNQVNQSESISPDAQTSPFSIPPLNSPSFSRENETRETIARGGDLIHFDSLDSPNKEKEEREGEAEADFEEVDV